MRISESIIKLLENNNTEYIFGIPASTIGGMLDSINDSNIEYIITKNEAGATYSASKYAELSNKLGVCMICGGVGVNNAINGIADAMRNKIPMLVISGDVRSTYIGRGALQEFDNAELAKSVTKYSVNIRNSKNALKEFKKAIDIALTAPYGPVLVSIPYDIQLLDFDGCNKEICDTDRIKNSDKNDYDALSVATETINMSSKGLIFIGRGTRGYSKEIKELSEKLKWPIMSTPNAKGIINTDFKNYIGNYGFCSSDGAISFVENEDIECILVLGSSLGQSATRDYNEVLFKNRKLIRVDFDKNELNKNFKEDVSVCSDIATALKYLNHNISTKADTYFVKPNMNNSYEKNHTGLSLRRFYEELSLIMPKDSNIIVDVGDFFNYIFKYMPIREDMSFQSSVNYACMGAGVAGAVGSYLADKNKVHSVFVGDGGFYMNGMDILTAKEYDMPIIYFVINNSMYGLVKNGMKAIFGREFESKVSFKNTDISLIAKGMGIDAVQIRDLSEVGALKKILLNRKTPLVVEVITDGTEIYIDSDRLKKA